MIILYFIKINIYIPKFVKLYIMRLIEHYLSIQGEGLHAGKPSYFIRFARCNLRCAWCDSGYTFGPGKEVSFAAVAQSLRRSRARYVCLTGGEPLLYPQECLGLMQEFPQLTFDIETGGSIAIGDAQTANSCVIMDWKLSASAMHKKMVAANLPRLRPDRDLLKFVSTGSTQEKKEILQTIKKISDRQVPVSIQPVFGSNPQALADWALSLKYPHLQFNLQLHKYIWPNRHRSI